MDELKGVDKIRAMADQLDTLGKEAWDIKGTGLQLRESAGVMRAFEKQQELGERAAWREAVRVAAANILPALPDMNLPCWEEDLDTPSDQSFMSRIMRRHKKRMGRVWPIAYLNQDEVHNYFDLSFSGGIAAARVNVMLVDEEGKLWIRLCQAKWANTTGSFGQSARWGAKIDLSETVYASISLVRSIEEVLESVENQKNKEKVARQGKPRETPKVVEDSPLLLSPAKVDHRGYYAYMKAWDNEPECAYPTATYEKIVKSINVLFERHKEWIAQKTQQIEKSVLAAGSPALKELAPVPKGRRP